MEQGFASSRLLGEHLREHGLLTLKPVHDPYYYPNYSGLPFLSSYYPPHRVQAWLGSFLTLDQAWVLYVLTMVLHFLVVSVGVFLLCYQKTNSMAYSCFGAMTLSYLGYSLKHNSCIVYTVAWIPVLLLASQAHVTILFGSSLGFMLLAGYWPIALYAIPVGCLAWVLG